MEWGCEELASKLKNWWKKGQIWKNAKKQISNRLNFLKIILKQSILSFLLILWQKSFKFKIEKHAEEQSNSYFQLFLGLLQWRQFKTLACSTQQHHCSSGNKFQLGTIGSEIANKSLGRPFLTAINLPEWVLALHLGHFEDWERIMQLLLHLCYQQFRLKQEIPTKISMKLWNNFRPLLLLISK